MFVVSARHVKLIGHQDALSRAVKIHISNLEVIEIFKARDS